MPIKRFDKTEQLAVGVGTAALTFTTATTGNRTYAAAGAEEGDQFWARIEHETLPAEWEICLATIVGGTIVRSTPTASSTGAAVAFSAGNKIVSDGVPFQRVPTADGETLTAVTTAADDLFPVWQEATKTWKQLTRAELTAATAVGVVLTADQSPFGVTPGSRIRADTTLDEIVLNLWPSPQDGDPPATIEDFAETWDENNLLVVAPEGTTFEPSGADTVRCSDGGLALSVWFKDGAWRVRILAGN